MKSATNGSSAAATPVDLVRQTVEGLRGQIDALQTERAALHDANCKLAMTALRREDAKALVLAFVDAKARAFEEKANWGGVIKLFAQPKGWRTQHQLLQGVESVVERQHTQPLCTADYQRVKPAKWNADYGLLEREHAVGLFGEHLGIDLAQGALYLLLKPQIKQALAEAFDRHWPADKPANEGDWTAMTLDERAELRALNVGRIEAISAEMEALQQQLGEISGAVQANLYPGS